MGKEKLPDYQAVGRGGQRNKEVIEGQWQRAPGILVAGELQQPQPLKSC